MPSTSVKQEIIRELARTKLFQLPESVYRTAMLEACADFDAWVAMDKRPGRFGKKAPKQAPSKPRRRKAA
jgi:hypothetical protein